MAILRQIFAASLAGYYHKIKIGHVEAGLRTGDLYSPWPEEANRQLTGVLANYHFAPTQSSYQNLINENVNPATVVVTGNTVIDALLQVKTKVEQEQQLIQTFEQEFSFLDKSKKLILVTGHRRENSLGKVFSIFVLLWQTLQKNILIFRSFIQFI